MGLFTYLFMIGCAGSVLLRADFLQLQLVGLLFVARGPLTAGASLLQSSGSRRVGSAVAACWL